MNPRLKAATERRKHYHAKPCKNCGSTDRYTSSGSCVQCTNAKAKEKHEYLRSLLQSTKGA